MWPAPGAGIGLTNHRLGRGNKVAKTPKTVEPRDDKKTAISDALKKAQKGQKIKK